MGRDVEGSALEWLGRLAAKFPEQVVLLDPTPPVVKAAALALGRIDQDGPCWLSVAHTDISQLAKLWRKLNALDLTGQALFYHGGLLGISRDFGIGPSLICAGQSSIDASSVQDTLSPGCHLLLFRDDDGAGEGMEKCLTLGLIELVESKPGARLFRTTGSCHGNGIRHSGKTLGIMRDLIHKRYFGDGPDVPPKPINDLTQFARRSWLQGAQPGASGYGPWPYVNPATADVPPTLPGGKPWPKFSIVTPSFNQGRYIEETILSVMNQGYPNVEHIVIDGGSSDATLGILEKYRHALAYFVSEKDDGQSHAINKGMNRATGEIVTWLNSDDMLAPGALFAMAMAFHTSNADMVAGICRIYSNGVLVDQHLTSCSDGPLPLNDILDLAGGWNQGQFFYQPEVMFRRSLWERAGGHVDEALYYSMDYELWVRFAESGAKLHVVGRPIAWFRQHSEQKTHIAAKFQAELAEFRKAYLLKTRLSFQPKPVPAAVRRRLRIVLLNDHGFQYGAGIAHKRLGEALALAGHELFPVRLSEHPLRENDERAYSNSGVLETIAACRPDVVVVGNIHSTKGDPGLLTLLAKRFRTACILHDFWLITGRCAYPGECTKYLAGCDENCPTPNEYPQLHPREIAGAWETKRSLFHNSSPLLLANSQWTADYVRQAFAAGPPGNEARVEPFQLSFDLDTFQPHDKKLSRKVLGLPENKFILLMTSEFADQRKGANLLLEALNELRLPDSLLASTSWSEPDSERVGCLDIRRLGYVDSPERLAMIYSAADLFVGASREETFGQTYIEAIACGTPVLGFDVAGVRDAIRDGVTGRRIEGLRSCDLAASILELYRNPRLRSDLARWGRLFVENEWSPFSAYRHFFLAMQRAGLWQELDVPPKITFVPRPAAVPEPRLASVSPPVGAEALCAKEGPAPDYTLTEFRWALGPTTAFPIKAHADGQQLVAIYYRNLHPNQAATVEINGKLCGEFALSETGMMRDGILVVRTGLHSGSNEVRLSFAKWGGRNADGWPMAIIITKVLVAMSKAVTASLL
jgi:glycosyltransferase involved in cell wall biosynthesis